MKNEYVILCYRHAYNALIHYLNEHYRPLVGRESDEDKSIFYQAEENSYQFYRLFTDYFHMAYKNELNEFLKNIHVTRDSHNEGSIVIFRWLLHGFNHYRDPFFRYRLAQFTILLANADKKDNPAMQFVKFNGQKAEEIQREIKSTCQSAKKIIDQYEQKDSKPLLQYPTLPLQFYIIKYGI